MIAFGVFHGNELCSDSSSLAIYEGYVQADMHRMTRELLIRDLKYDVKKVRIEVLE